MFIYVLDLVLQRLFCEIVLGDKKKADRFFTGANQSCYDQSEQIVMVGESRTERRTGDGADLSGTVNQRRAVA